jgi:hypothetical protein
MGRANDNDRYVQQRQDGMWGLITAGHQRASAVGETQAQMINRAAKGGPQGQGRRACIKGRNGRIRDKDTIAPGYESPMRDES